MEIRNWNWYIIINCILLPFVVTKTFSLNEALAAESQLRSLDTSSPISTETTAQRFSLNKVLTTETPTKHKLDKFLADKLSLSKYNKNNHIKSVYKAKKSKHILRPFHLRRNSFKKREIFNNDKYNKKYFPILKNLGLLLDNLLNSEPVDSYEVSKSKQKRHKYQPEKRPGIVCKCALQSDSEIAGTRTHKKTTILTKTAPAESTITTTATPDTTLGDISSIRQNKDIPILLPRNSLGDRGNSHGHDEGSSPAFYGSFERNIARNIRNRKHHSKFQDEQSSTERYKKITNSNPRDHASSNEYRRQNRGNADIPIDRRAANKREKYEKEEEDNDIFRGSPEMEHTGTTQLEVRANETKSENFVPKYVRRLRRPVPKIEDDLSKKPIQSKKDYEKSINYVSFVNTSDQRITGGSSTNSIEDKEASPGNEDMISLKDLSNLNLALQKKPKMETPTVTIIDGYSIARDKNGKNKLAEKTIHIHT